MTDLYAFTSHKFTNAGTTGMYGPTLATVRTEYSHTTWANSYLNMTTRGIQEWTVPVTGTYTIRAVGASASNDGETTVQVGNPADITGTFLLTRGEVVKILVGQSGWIGASTYRRGWGGGGGTFVVKSDANNTPLVVAGGCGSGHTLNFLRKNDESAQMGGPAVNNNVALDVKYISFTNTGEKVYIVKDGITKMVTASGAAKYYSGEPEDYNPANYPTYTLQASPGAYVMSKVTNFSIPVTYMAPSASGIRQNANTGTSGMLETGGPGTWTNPSVGGGDGAGYNSDGSVGNGIIHDLLPTINTSSKPLSFLNGGVGGSSGGGFGGGGSTTNTWGGGGGGYNGGQGGKTDIGYNTTYHNGGGGGSYNSGTNQTNILYANTMTDIVHGFVEITILAKTSTLTASQSIFYQRFISGASISFNVISSNAGNVARTHESSNTSILSIPTASTPSGSIVAPGKVTIKVTQPATGNYSAVTENSLITIVIVGSGVTYSSENMTSIDLSGTNLTGSVFSDCNLTSANLTNANLTNSTFSGSTLLTSANLYGTTVNASTNLSNLSTATLTNVRSGRIIGITSYLPNGFKLI